MQSEAERFGPFGGRYVPETLISALDELEAAYAEACAEPAFREDLDLLLRDYVGRPSPLYRADRLEAHVDGTPIFLKREDLNHTGAHKINNTIGQGLLARRMGKRRIIAETGAGQHGVATATACALFDLDTHQLTGISILALAAFLFAPDPVAAAPKKMPMPDFTKSDPIPAGANHDWNLGATGARGWMYCDKLVTVDARQIRITKVDEGSPADGVLEIGDVILGAGGKPFSYDPRTEMGRALTEAETGGNGGALKLIRWRGGKTETVVVKRSDDLQRNGEGGLYASYADDRHSRRLATGLRCHFEEWGYCLQI